MDEAKQEQKVGYRVGVNPYADKKNAKKVEKCRKRKMKVAE